MRRSVAYTVLVLVSFSTAWAAGVPVAVSPGDASRLALIGDVCPTFSWDAVEGAAAHELVVYRVGEDGKETKPVLKRDVPGSASSWTPSLEHCLERGGQYAWSVRAVGEKVASQWSAPSLFEIAARPSAAEFEQAVGVVRQYLARGGDTEARAAVRSESSSETSRKPSPNAPAPIKLSVDGRVDASSFSGSGALLTGVDADSLDSLDSISFLRSDANDSYTNGTLFFSSGTMLDVEGTLRMVGPVLKTGTGKVINFNADFLDGQSAVAFFRLSQDETVTGRPAFNGGFSGSSSPFTVDSNSVVPSLNADFVDGLQASALVRTTQVQAGKIDNGASPASPPCPATGTETFSPAFGGALPAVVLTPEGWSPLAENIIGDTYCVIGDITHDGFTHCCYGNPPSELHWIAVGLDL